MRIPWRTTLASAAAWLFGAVAAVLIGMQSVALIGEGAAADSVQPLTPADGVWPAPAVGPSTTPDRPPSPPADSASSPATAASRSTAASNPSGQVDHAVSSPGGIAVVRCAGTQAYLVSWTPQRGYRASEVRRGPAERVSVKFVAREREVTVSASCAGGVPTPTIETDDEAEHRNG